MAASSTHVSRRSGSRQLPTWLRDAQRLDVAIYAAIAETPTPSLDRLLSRLTQASNYWRLWLGSAAILAATRGACGRRATVAGLASAAVSSAVANLVIKPLGRRRRPDPNDMVPARRAPVPGSTSFPSGHSATAFAFATGVGSVLPREAIPIRVLAAAVAYSRVHTGAHYPSDAIAGALLGTMLAQVTSHALARWS
jgi:membrane-associated phospholipid phosphatase